MVVGLKRVETIVPETRGGLAVSDRQPHAYDRA